ncbi:FAD:protein FMN transferase [Rhodoblastus acidophilus]|uniref:FAD:protein FMN transferase n=1 Tax=Candidatus Rhodoblastus alkanivorans TaxID=2954117 RepID=A0ABS9Z4S4_9HYPH|nr:FAD:protein FMN transferase [Candidatus Rhodoblastus alkanivorans]MCI4677589.1 FAD:protein FMN transferase [Candidatus Rhodoblastus alkanivorans]MCI4682679.1 FAD:protein FMN transferase [Candidatus Rhodoblastus alkanivorans]MDI4639986.1 FAD:protein FMN transferase [Rhodoblastus acidophilus]
MSKNRRQMLQLALMGASLSASGVWAASASRDEPVFRRIGVAFDTGVGLTVVGLDRKEAEAALDAGFAEIHRLERVAGLSTPGSDIRRLNAEGRLEKPDPAMLEMLAVADEVHRASGGAFDVTVQPLWIFYDSYARRGAWPTGEEAAPARALIGHSHMRFDAEAVSFDRPGMGITMNSLTHGYAADRVAKVLSDLGVRRAFVDTGEMESLGRGPQDREWTVAVKNPRQTDAMLGTAPLTGCMATAGDYAYTWSADYTRNHILDPRTGLSPASFATVVVIAPRAVVADALSTTVSVLGPDEGAKLLTKFDAEAYGITKAGKVWATPGFPRQHLA